MFNLKTEWIDRKGRMYDEPQRYWQAKGYDKEGTVHYGEGKTEEEAKAEVGRKVDEANKFLAKSPMEQLEELASTTDILGISGHNQQRMLKLIVKVLKGHSRGISEASKYAGVPCE